MTPARLLLVEDEFLIRMMLSESLMDAGYEVLEAADADEAMAQLERDAGGIAVMLTDIQLPGTVDGNELARRVRETHPHLPVIFMTGRPDPDARAAAHRRDVFISKPYLPSDVCAAVARLLAGG